ncbi:uncharacterized protein [Coffea arabica]|uniref:Reverse transcriptase domain-containing protein n=1 Tax=Coffea arabica TaxID=13443 RepID=A0ABM4UFB9_COFAR
MELIVDLRDIQERVGNISSRGTSEFRPRRGSATLSDTLHLDSVADTSVALLLSPKGDEHPDVAQSRQRGVRARFPSDCTLRSIHEEEKRGGLPFRLSDGLEFGRFMLEAGVSDAGFSGSKYTWCNNRQGRARVWKRLDRVLLNLEALQMGSNISVQHLARDPSDHSPLLMSAVTRLDNKPKPFHFLNVWTTKGGVLEVIRDAWSCELSGQPFGVLAAKLRTVKQALKRWPKESFGDIFKAVREAERAVREAKIAQEHDSSDHVLRDLNVARERLRATLATEEGFWKQKARVRWLKDGDRNTQYFHAVVAERRSRAIIHRIRGANGEWVESEELISREAISFFQGLFTAELGYASYEFLDNIPKLVTDRDNTRLMEPPTMAEVKQVVFSMDGESAAGSDGFTGQFFMFAWEVVAEDVYKAVLSFFCGAELPRSITATTVVLIPKSGFVKGRQLADNFLLAQELVSDIGKSSRGGNVVLKLDMMKAYDRVSWSFLLQVLRRFRFSETWIDAIWRLVSNVWFSVLINGIPQGFFRSSRGLRQGDPLSPALFVIGAEALSRALNALVEHRQFHPYKVPIGCPIVTHLAFADDVVIFTSGLKSSLRLLMRNYQAFNGLSEEGIPGQIIGLPVIRWASKEGVFWGDLQGHCQQNLVVEAANPLAGGKSGSA